MEQLADMGIEIRRLWVVAEGRDVFGRSPTANFLGRRKFFHIDVDHGSVRRAEFVGVVESIAIDIFREFEAIAAGFGEADEFLKPRRASSLDVHACVEAPQRATDGGVNRKLVAAGVDAELEVWGQRILFGRMSEHSEIVVKLLFELDNVTDVID